MRPHSPPSNPRTPRRRACRLATISLASLIALALLPANQAHAAPWTSWLSAGEPTSISDLKAATAALRTLPTNPAAPTLAAHATPEGHWLFTNASSETFTAGTPAELKRVPDVLAPGAKDGFASLRILLSRDSLFAGPAVLKELPPTQALFVALDGETVDARLTPRNTIAVLLRPNVTLEATTKETFLEALAQLRRPLDAARMRILSATPGAPPTLPASPKFDAAQNGAAIDPIEPDHLAAALSAIPRQTAILTARIDGANLAVLPPSGPERTIPLAGLTAAADAADVDLLILHADPPRQPGGRNWLWQRIQVSGLDHATKRGTLADFLDQLAAGRSAFAVTVVAESDTRTRLTAAPLPTTIATSQGMTDWLKQAAGMMTGAVTSQVTGAVQPASVHASLVSTARRQTLAHRLIPALPASAPLLYAFAALLGLAGLPVAKRWWRKIWPMESRADYPDARGYTLARLIRTAAFLAIFLPLAAIPAVVTRLLTLAFRRKPKPQTAV